MQKTARTIDAMHSSIEFKIKHLLVSSVTGKFKTFSGSAVTEGPELENTEISVEIDVASIDTSQPGRDEHLLGADFFDVSNHPKITFASTSFKKIKGENYLLAGDLTVKGITKAIELHAEYGGKVISPLDGVEKLGFEITGTINRTDFGITFNSVLDSGGLALGENVKLTANIELDSKA